MSISSRSWFVAGALIAAAACSKSEGAAPAPSPSPKEAKPTEDASAHLIVIKGSVGAIARASDHRVVEQAFPKAQLTELTCTVGEDEESKCSRVGTDLLVVWDDKGTAEEVHVFSDAFATADGIRVGMTLADLAARNGGPVTLFNSYVIGTDGKVVDGWQVEDFGDGKLKDSNLILAVRLPDGAVEPLRPLQSIESADKRVPAADVRITSIGVRLDGSPRLEFFTGDEGEGE